MITCPITANEIEWLEPSGANRYGVGKVGRSYTIQYCEDLRKHLWLVRATGTLLPCMFDSLCDALDYINEREAQKNTYTVTVTEVVQFTKDVLATSAANACEEAERCMRTDGNGSFIRVWAGPIATKDIKVEAELKGSSL